MQCQAKGNVLWQVKRLAVSISMQGMSLYQGASWLRYRLRMHYCSIAPRYLGSGVIRPVSGVSTISQQNIQRDPFNYKKKMKYKPVNDILARLT